MALNSQSFENAVQRQQLAGPLGQSVLLILVIVLFSWFLLKPAYSKYQQTHTDLAAAKQQLTAVENDKAELSRLVSQLKSSEQEVKITDEALPLIGRVTRLDVLIDTLAKSSGLQVAQITAQDTDSVISAANPEEKKDLYGATRSLQTTKVDVFVTGSIDQFRNFLQLLETTGRIIDISDLNITTGEGVVRYEVTLKAYSYGVPSPTSSN